MKIYSTNKSKLLIFTLIFFGMGFALLKIPSYIEKTDQEKLYYEYRFSLDKIDLKLITRLPSQTESNAIVTNANFFDKNSKALGLAVSRNSRINKLHQNSKLLNGVLLWKKGQIKIIKTEDYNSSLLDSYELALQSGPLLVSAGKAASLQDIGKIGYNSRRLALCTTKQNEFLLFASKQKLTLSEMQQILIFELLCSEAINLDGGSSVQLYNYSDSGKKQTYINSLVRPPIFLQISY